MLYAVLYLTTGFILYKVLFFFCDLVSKKNIRKFELSDDKITEAFRFVEEGRSLDSVVSTLQSQNTNINFGVDYS